MLQKLDKLFTLLKEANDAYYNSSHTLFSDEVYDDLLDIYNARSPEKFSLIGAPTTITDKVKLPLHMGSMNKTYSIKEFVKWLEKNPTNTYVVTPKIDGSSCMIVFSRGGTIKIYSRGDGAYGKDLDHLTEHIITPETKRLVGKFLETNELDSMTVRGELMISKSNFDEKVDGEFKSPRSLVNGLSNKKESSKSVNVNLLEFVLFEMCSPALKPSSQFEYASKMGFTIVEPDIMSLDNMLLKNQTIETSYLLKTLENHRKNYKYDIDGLIITCDRVYEVPEQGNPAYSIAFKSNGSGEITTVTNIEWNVSKHGMLIPTIVFEKIILGKSVVTRCTGFNGRFIFNNSLGTGAKIRVVLSGEVIPYITQVIEQGDFPEMPNTHYVWNQTNIHCVLKEESTEFEIKRIVNFVKTIGIENLGIGMIKILFASGFNTVDKLLNISHEELLKIDRIEEKMAKKIRCSIDKVTKNPVDLALIMDGSLCFGNGFGIKRCKQITTHFPNFQTNLPEDGQLLELDGWSIKSVEKFRQGLSVFKKFMAGTSLKIYTKSAPKTSQLELTKICITGKRDKEIIDFAITHGIEIASSITNDVDVLICEDKTAQSGKLRAAQSKNIPILSTSEFKDKIKLN